MSDVGMNVVQNAPEMAEQAINLWAAFIKLLKSMMKDRQDDKTLKDMYEHTKSGGKVKTFIARDFSEKDFKNELEKLGCTSMTARITAGPNKGLVLCMVKEEDLALAMVARERALSHGGRTLDEYGGVISPTSEVSLNTLQSQMKQNEAGCIISPVLSEAKAKFLVEELRVRNISFSRKTEDTDTGKRTVFYFSSDDKERVSQCLARTNIEFKGVSGNYKNQRMMEDIRKVRTAMSYIDKNSSKDEFYVVSAANPRNVIHVEGHSLSHSITDEEGRQKAYRSVNGLTDHTNLQKVYKQEVDSMKYPVVLTEKEYNECFPDMEKLEELVFSKRSAIVYSSKTEKLNVHTEERLKAMLNKKLYPEVASGTFDYASQKKLLSDVTGNGIPLDVYLEPNSEKDIEFLNGLSDEENRIYASFLEECLDEYSFSKEAIQDYVLDTEELHLDLDEIIKEASATLDYTDTTRVQAFDFDE